MWNFIKGYVIIQIEGLSAAALLRRLTEAGVRVSHVTSVGPGTVRCSIPVKRFFALRKLRRGLSLRIHIVSRGGLPFLLRKLRRRPVLWIGTTALFCAMTVLSQRIWIIRIDETKRVDPNEILTLLDERGIRPGAYLSGPILITAANDLSAQIHDGAWIGLDREGVMLKVSVVEAIPESPKKTDRVPYDVVAEKDGIVLSLRVMCGQARVAVGDRVSAGDVLISGTAERNGAVAEQSADGTVTAAVAYRAEAEVVYTVTEAYETENTETVRVLRLFEWELLRSTPDFAHYWLTDAHTAIFGMLPVTVEFLTAREIGFFERTLSGEEAEQLALSSAREQAFSAVPKDAAIINTYGTVRERDGKRIAVVTVTAEEIIGRTEEAPHDG